MNSTYKDIKVTKRGKQLCTNLRAERAAKEAEAQEKGEEYRNDPWYYDYLTSVHERKVEEAKRLKELRDKEAESETVDA